VKSIIEIFFLKKEEKMSAQGIVQYILVRSDLCKTLGWPVGALVAQACHASTAAIHMFYDHEDTKKYLSDLDNMHKIILSVPNEQDLKSLEQKLLEANVDHKMWIEQPENFPTCLAVRPYPKEQVQKYFKKFKLFKD